MLKKKKKGKATADTVSQPITIEQVEKEIKDQIDKSGSNLSEKEKQIQFEALKGVLIDGKLPAEAFNLNDDFTTLVYKMAYDRYNLGLYKEANQMFRFLCFLNPYSAKYQLGLAATNHRLENYEVAAMIYYTAWFCDKDSPIPLVYCSDCYMKMKQPGSAYFTLHIAYDLCGDKPEYAKLKAKCHQMMEGLQDRYHLIKKEGTEEDPKKTSEVSTKTA